MSEKFTSHHDEDDSVDSDEKPSGGQEHSGWRPSEQITSESKPWWLERERPTPIIPESEEVRSYAAERQSSFATELSSDDDEETEEEKEKPKDEFKSISEKKPQERESEEKSTPEEEIPPGIEKTDEKAEQSEMDDDSVQAAKEVAREELETRPTEDVENDPTVDYLEKVAEEGNPIEAEQEIIEEHDLKDAQDQAELLIKDLEDILEKVAGKVGDRQLSDEEMLALAHEVVPDTGENQVEDDSKDLEAFAPEPKGPPELPDILTHHATKGRANINPSPTLHHHFNVSPVNPIPGGGSPPPVPPSGGGGGGGSGGSGGGGVHGLATLAGAMNPNMQPWLSAAELARLQKKNVSRELFIAAFAYFLGRHVGKNKGHREKEAELKPTMEKQAKVNKQQRAEIITAEKRIESLKRIKDAQERELAKTKHHERIVSPLGVSTPEAPVPVVRSEQPELESKALSSAPSDLDQAVPLPLQEKVRSAPANLTKGEVGLPLPATEQAAAPKSAPELPDELSAHPQTIETSAATFPEISPEPGSSTKATESQTEARPTFPSEKSLETEQAPSVSEEVESSTTPEENKAQEPETERSFGTSSRSDIASTAPGLEIPLPTGPPEAQSVIPSLFESNVEHRGAVASSREPEAVAPEAVSAMNLPELITVAKEITIGGENLGRIFEGRQIDNAGLRRVVAEYARGGNPEKVLAQERHVMELRRQSPEFVEANSTDGASSSTGGGAGAGAGGGAAGLFAQATSQPDHMLPAYDHEQYPSDTPQHLLPVYDQETITQKHHRTIVAASALVGLGIGVLLTLLFI